jgi:hypothetical protein
LKFSAVDLGEHEVDRASPRRRESNRHAVEEASANSRHWPSGGPREPRQPDDDVAIARVDALPTVIVFNAI